MSVVFNGPNRHFQRGFCEILPYKREETEANFSQRGKKKGQSFKSHGTEYVFGLLN